MCISKTRYIKREEEGIGSYHVSNRVTVRVCMMTPSVKTNQSRDVRI